jgi:hypothetical protein
MSAKKQFLEAKRNRRFDQPAISRQMLQQRSSTNQPNTSKAVVNNSINSKNANVKANVSIGHVKKLCNYTSVGAPCRRSNCLDLHDAVIERDENIQSSFSSGPPQRSEAVPSINITKSAGKKIARQGVQPKAPPPDATGPAQRMPPKGSKKDVKIKTDTRQDGACLPKAFVEPNGHMPNNRSKVGKRSAKKCRDLFGKGSCSRGENCNFSHDPDLNRTSVGKSADISSINTAVCGNTPAKLSVGYVRPVVPSGEETSGTKTTLAVVSAKDVSVEDAEVTPISATQNDKKKKPRNRMKFKPLAELDAEVKPIPTTLSVTERTYSEVARLSPADEAARTKLCQSPQPSCKPHTYESPSDLAILASSRPTSADIDPAVKVTNLGFGSWDGQAMLYWMDRNLSPQLKTQLKKKYRPYLEKGLLPMSVVKLEKRKGKGPRFPFFPFLPYEIREMVWKIALCDSYSEATVKIDEKHLPNGTYSMSVRPTSRPPRLMRVSQEAQHIAAKFYEKAFATTTGGPAKTWFNFEKDCLVLLGGAYHRLSENLLKCDVKRLKYLTLPLRCWLTRIESEKQLLVTMLLPFRNLMKIWILAGDGKDDEQYIKDERIITEIRYLVRTKFQKFYKSKDCFPDVEQKLIPALQARSLKIDALMY